MGMLELWKNAMLGMNNGSRPFYFRINAKLKGIDPMLPTPVFHHSNIP